MEIEISNIIANHMEIDIMYNYGEATLANYLDLVEDLGMDSLDLVELIVVLEDKYNVVISDEDAEEIRTVGDVIKYLKKVGVRG